MGQCGTPEHQPHSKPIWCKQISSGRWLSKEWRDEERSLNILKELRVREPLRPVMIWAIGPTYPFGGPSMMASKSRYANNLLEKLHIPPFLQPSSLPVWKEAWNTRLRGMDGSSPSAPIQQPSMASNPNSNHGVKQLFSWADSKFLDDKLVASLEIAQG